ncbi:MAG: efflux RND transporter permease subunit [Pseudomonadales bacterium]|nr:efflux RND transporter permease subunit [Pseudomonadales bacterium]
MRLPYHALNNPQFTLVLLMLVLALGAFSFVSMPRSEDPQFDFASATIVAVYPGTTPVDIEKMIVDPIEDALHELEDVKKIQFNIRDGLATGYIEFIYGSDPDDKFDDVQRTVAEVRSQLPAGLRKLEVRRNSPSNVNIFQVALLSDFSKYSELKLMAEKLEKQFERLSGVKTVDTWGYPDQQVQIVIDPDKMLALNISIDQLKDAIVSTANNIPGGHVNMGERRFNVRSSGDYESLDQIGWTVVKQVGDNLVYLKDVANILMADDIPTYIARFNGKRCVYITVIQRENSNIYQVTEDLNTTLAKYSTELPDGMTTEIVVQQVTSVTKRINGFFLNLMQGLALVALVVFLVLGFRASLIVTTAIPLSILIAVGWLDLANFGLQQMSIVGLVIALGLLVDNAIVVIENIGRHLRNREENGQTGMQAVASGASEVGWAVASGTVTTVLSFIPIAWLQTDTGTFIRSMPLTVIFALVSSLAIALTITPLLSGKVFLKKDGSSVKSVGKGLIGMTRLANVHGKMVRGCLKHPFIVVVVALGLFIGSLSLFPLVGVSLFPNAEKPQFLVNISLPENSSFASTDKVTWDVEQYLLTLPEITHVAANIGRANPAVYYNEFPSSETPTIGQLFVQHKDIPMEQSQALIRKIRKYLDGYVGANLNLREFKQGPGNDAPITIRIVGDELGVLKALSIELEEVIRSVPGTINLSNGIAKTRLELQVDINRDKAALLGVPLSRIDSVVRATLVGSDVALYRDPSGEDYPIVIKLNNRGEARLDDLRKANVSNVQGQLIPLRQLATFKLESAPAYFQHRDRIRSARVSAYVDIGYSIAEVSNEVQNKLSKIDIPSGYRFLVGGEQEARNESFNGMMKTLIIALLGIFAVLVLQFRSFIQPLIVFIAIPFAITGAILALLITGYTFSFTAFVGLTSLIGIVVNNSIILVDFANGRIADGEPVTEAILQAAKIRFQPIVLTTLTTIGGLLPLTLSGSTMWAPMGWAIIGGLIVSTFLTLLLVPVLYKIFTPALSSQVEILTPSD